MPIGRDTATTLCKKAFVRAMNMNTRLTPRFSGGVLPLAAHRERIMKRRARGAHVMSYHRPLQAVVRRWHDANAFRLFVRRAHRQPSSLTMLLEFFEYVSVAQYLSGQPR